MVLSRDTAGNLFVIRYCVFLHSLRVFSRIKNPRFRVRFLFRDYSRVVFYPVGRMPFSEREFGMVGSLACSRFNESSV